jgi:hypothetical protein
MFLTCPQAMEIWHETNKLGHLAWADYTDFNYNQIPYLLEVYSPLNLFKVSTLWALWVHWCKHIHDPDHLDQYDDYRYWVQTVLLKAKLELLHRLYEARSAIQWMRLVLDRRTAGENESRIPEKEFLLIQSHLISVNSDSLLINKETTVADELFIWAGNSTIIKIDHTNINKPKFRFDHSFWKEYTIPPDEGIGPRSEGEEEDDDFGCPQFLISDY